MIVAFIPVRGGSKSIPLKNIKLMAGKPLVYWTCKAASDCTEIDDVYVATDSPEIRDAVEGFKLQKVHVIDRDAENASDTASTESAMLEFASKYDFDDIVLIQATSPLLTGDDLSNGIEMYREPGTDSVLSVVRQKRFVWKAEGNYAVPVNYDYNSRPRRQEFDGYLVENGAFYITSKKALIETRCRLFGNIKACEMDESTYFEIDEPSDFIISEGIMHARDKKKHTTLSNGAGNETGAGTEALFGDVRMLLTDCDGVLTDGGMYYTENGDEIKKFNTKDGFGLRLLKEHGIITGIITGEDRELNRRRANKIGVDELVSHASDKVAEIRRLCKKYNVELNEVAYIGDDLNDLEAIKMVGIGCCPPDAAEALRQQADYVTHSAGGRGVVREIADLILAASAD